MRKPVSLELRPDIYYWVRRREPSSDLEVARVSAVFGEDPDYWTVTRAGSDVHHMLDEFEFLAEVMPPTVAGQSGTIR
ncbi:hypothetical protein EV561_11923 [Rhizobium sp. BK376]|nr:hypothetical protein EV561_11923 [Rhizobium sp. BK376]